MYYRVERTYLTNVLGKYDRTPDRKPYLVLAGDASAAATAFVTDEHGHLLGPVTPLRGDKATATAAAGQRVFVIFVERAQDAIHLPKGS